MVQNKKKEKKIKEITNILFIYYFLPIRSNLKRFENTKKQPINETEKKEGERDETEGKQQQTIIILISIFDFYCLF